MFACASQNVQYLLKINSEPTVLNASYIVIKQTGNYQEMRFKTRQKQKLHYLLTHPKGQFFAEQYGGH